MKMLSIHGLGGLYGTLRGPLLWLAAAALGAVFGMWQGGPGNWDFLLIVMALCGTAAAVLVADAVQMGETGLERRFAPHLQPRPLRRGLAALLRPAAAPLAAALGLAAVLVWGAPLAATIGLSLVVVQVGAVGAVAVLQDRSPAATAALFLLTLAITGGVFRQALALAIMHTRVGAPPPWWTVAPGGLLTMCLGFALLAIVAAVAAMGWRLRQPVDTALLPLGSVVALALFCVVPLATGLADGVPLRALLLPAMGLALLVGLVQATMPPPRLWPRLPPTLLPLLAAAVTLLPALAVLSTMNEALSAGILLLTAAADAVLLQVFLQRTPAVALSAFAVLQVARAVLPSALGDGLPGWSILSLDGQQGDPVVAALSGAVQLVAALLCLRSARLPPRASAADRAQAPAAMWQFWAAVAAAVSLCAVSVDAAWGDRMNRFYDLPEFVLLAGAGLAWCHLRADIAHRRRVALDGFQQAPRGCSQALLRIAGPIFVDSLAASIGIGIGNYLILLRAQQPLSQVLRWDAVLGVALAMLASLLALSLERAGTRLRAPVLLGIVWLAAMVLQASAAIGQLPLAFSNTVYSGVPPLDTLARRCLVIVLVVALLWLPAIASALRRWPAWGSLVLPLLCALLGGPLLALFFGGDLRSALAVQPPRYWLLPLLPLPLVALVDASIPHRVARLAGGAALGAMDRLRLALPTSLLGLLALPAALAACRYGAVVWGTAASVASPSDWDDAWLLAAEIAALHIAALGLRSLLPPLPAALGVVAMAVAVALAGPSIRIVLLPPAALAFAMIASCLAVWHKRRKFLRFGSLAP